MEIGLAVGGSVLSSVLQVVLDRIAPSQNFLGWFQGNKKLPFNRLQMALETINVVLEDAEDKQERSPAVKSWFNSLKHVVYQAEDLLDEINTERLRMEVHNSKGNLSDAGFNDQFIGELSPRLEEICDTLERYVSHIGVFGLKILEANQKGANRLPSTSVVTQSQIFGRDDEKEKIVQMLMSDDEGGSNVSVIPVTGMGGIGKTALAQLVYNDKRVKNHFKTRAWVCVSEEFDFYRATKGLLMEVNSSVVDDNDDLNRLQVKLKDNLEGKRFIIILDDLWNESSEDCQRLMMPLDSGSRGSKIIVTTRSEKIAKMLPSEPFHRLQPIPNDQSWSLFKLHAFGNRALTSLSEFETIGRTIVEKCKGLPLAIKTVASALRSKSNIREWRDILKSEIWKTGGDILPALSLSYKLLPSHLKCCFAFCAIFPKDVPFDKEEVALLWMANDLIQPSSQSQKDVQNYFKAQNYFEELRLRSLFEMVDNDKYLMHDLVNDLARYVSGNFCVRIEDYQSKDLHQEVLHFSYLSSKYDTLKRFRGLAQVQGLRTFLPVHQSKYSLDKMTTLFFSEILPKLRHIRALSLHQYGVAVIPDSIGDLKHLRFLNLAGSDHMKKLPSGITKCLNLQTLILAGCWNLQELPEEMGLLINLQHLDISRCMELKELPNDMGLLINLQHLDISGCTGLKELPNDMGLLINLQHLDISRCRKLKELPNDMGLLINLQHLDISGCTELKELPNGMGLLTNLQHLVVRDIEFNLIGKMESWLRKLKDIQNLSIVVDKIHGSALEQLHKLQLGRDLEISGLDNAVTVEVAKNAELKNKSCIENLTLEWSGVPECSKDELNIFAELIPHTNIVQLIIKGYRGTTFSDWLGDSSFCNIESLTLTDCKNCFLLPPLGQLTGLKRLKISGMDRITEVGEEFYGDSSLCKPFQVLESLVFSNMAEWTTWITHPYDVAFLSLRDIRISNCPKLVGDIPFHLASLRRLEMEGLHSLHCNLEGSFLSSTLEEAKSSNLLRLKKMTQGIEYLKITDCPTISVSLQSCDVKRLEMKKCKHVEFPTIDNCNSSIESLTITHSRGDSAETIPLFSFSKLQKLYMWNWESPNMFKFPNGYHQNLTSLQSLSISGCNNLLWFPKGGLPAPNLKEFRVYQCNQLKSLPEQMHTQLSSLHYLHISSCPEMECFPDGGLPPSLETLLIGSCKKLMMFPRNWGLQRLPSLIQLDIEGFEDKLFPEVGLLPASLQRLIIWSCRNLEALNHKGFQDITSLKDLTICNCPELRYLPEDGLPSSLSQLYIYDCPKLNIEREKGGDWPKVSHIPIIGVDEELIT